MSRPKVSPTDASAIDFQNMIVRSEFMRQIPLFRSCILTIARLLILAPHTVVQLIFDLAP